MDNETEQGDYEKAREAVQKLRDAVQGLATLLDKGGAISTGWVICCEWMDSNGDFWFSTHADPEGPVWKINGMLSHAQAFITSDHFTEGSKDEGNLF